MDEEEIGSIVKSYLKMWFVDKDSQLAVGPITTTENTLVSVSDGDVTYKLTLNSKKFVIDVEVLA